MYDVSVRRSALAMLGQGRSLNSVSKQTGISRWALRSWQNRLLPLRPERAECTRCAVPPEAPADAPAYAYLLGLYLGDGCVSRLARTYTLRIACADAWPGLIEECSRAVKAVRPHHGVFHVQAQGCVMVTAYNSHWPCLFPQHGPGKKHERRIELQPWQRQIVAEHPWRFVRGLVHSDGSRITNWTTRVVRGRRKRYEYPRYFFTNKSGDIVRFYCETLDAVGVAWRSTRSARNAYSVSVARRASVALMDEHVGPKY